MIFTNSHYCSEESESNETSKDFHFNTYHL